MIRDHRRAQVAHEHVAEVSGSSDPVRRAYGSHCHKLAVLVHQAGLAAALHHTMALKDPKPRLVAHLATQLHEAELLSRPDAETLLAAVRQADLSETWLLTREVRRCLEWYRRLAHGVLGVRSAADAPEEAT